MLFRSKNANTTKDEDDAFGFAYFDCMWDVQEEMSSIRLKNRGLELRREVGTREIDES